MTGQHARIAANVILASAGAAAAYVIVTRPPLRRFVFGALRVWLGASAPIYLAREVARAWRETAPASHRS